VKTPPRPPTAQSPRTICDCPIPDPYVSRASRQGRAVVGCNRCGLVIDAGQMQTPDPRTGKPRPPRRTAAVRLLLTPTIKA